MSTETFYCPKITMEKILWAKCSLKKKEILEPVLSFNMDFAAREIMSMDPALLSGASLSVFGESALVEFFPNPDVFSPPAQKIQNRIRFTVMSTDGQPQLIRHVTCSGVITDSDIKDAHFSGHICQDRVKSCVQQAQEIVSELKMLKIFQIICNGLSLTYSVKNSAAKGLSVDHQSPQTCYTLKTRYRTTLEYYNQVQQLLGVRCWLEQERPQKKGLIACIDHLLQKVSESKRGDIHGRFFLQSDGEVVELLCVGIGVKSYQIFSYSKGICMIPDEV